MFLCLHGTQRNKKEECNNDNIQTLSFSQSLFFTNTRTFMEEIIWITTIRKNDSPDPRLKS